MAGLAYNFIANCECGLAPVTPRTEATNKLLSVYFPLLFSYLFKFKLRRVGNPGRESFLAREIIKLLLVLAGFLRRQHHVDLEDEKRAHCIEEEIIRKS